MTVKELRRNAINKYKSHKLESWLLGLFAGLFCAAIVLINLLVPWLTFITVPLLILPFIFGCTVIHEALKEGMELTFTNFFKYIMVFFRSPFNHSYNLISSFLKSLLIFLLSELIAVNIAYGVFSHQYGELFVNAINELDSLIEANAEIEVILSAFEANDNLLINYFLAALEPSLLISIFCFIFFLGKESVSIYLRIIMSKSNPSFIRSVYRRGIRDHFSEFYKAYIGLNWPLYVLLAIGFVGGALFVDFTKLGAMNGVTLGVVFGFVLSGFFYPFYFANNVSLYESFEPYFKQSTKDCIQDMLRKMEYFTDISPEEKEKFTQMMNQTGDPLREEEEENKDNKEE